MAHANPTPLISVIMPCLNGEQHLEAAIGSVLNQTFSDLELVVVDNGSTDRTPEIVQSLRDRRIRALALAARGVSGARNLGVRKARGEFVAFLDSDDTWNPDFLEKMHGALASDQEAVLAYCGWQNVGLPGPRGEPFVPPDYEREDKAAALLVGCRWPIHACLTRRSTIMNAGCFSTELTIGEDYLLWMEVAASGRIIRVPEVLAQYHHHDGVQATGNQALVALDTFKAKRLFLRRHPEVMDALGTERITELTWGDLLAQGNALYWRGNLEHARPVFRKVLLTGHGSFSAKMRMLPSLLPLWLHRAIMATKDKCA